MSLTYCMSSNCPLAAGCQRYEDNASAHCLQRTYADFSEELVRGAEGAVSCPFFIAREVEPLA